MNRGNRWFFFYGFGKNERANIDKDDLRFLQEVAKELLALDEMQIVAALWPAKSWRCVMVIKKRKSRILGEMHEAARGLHEIGLMDK